MIVRQPELQLGDAEAAIAARLESEGSAFEPAVLRLGVSPEYGQWLDRTANPFVPVATALATAVGEDLRFEAPVCPRLGRGAEQASRKFAGWWGYRATRIDAPVLDRATTAGEVAALFSGGVDTSATVIRSLRGEIDERATHLLDVYGAEWKLSPDSHEAIWRENEAAAAAYGLPLLRLTTNAPQVLHGRISWPRSYGAAFASSALSLGPRFGTVLSGSSQLPEANRPHGTRPDLDPLWSTESTAIHPDAAELGKLGRVAIVASEPTALEHLTVCWVGDVPANCGRCEKCLRTMTCLAIAGALERTDRFEAPLTVEAIRACEPSRNSLSLTEELIDRMPHGHEDLRAAWEEKLCEGLATERAERRRKAQRPSQVRWRRLRRHPRRAIRRVRRRWLAWVGA